MKAGMSPNQMQIQDMFEYITALWMDYANAAFSTGEICIMWIHLNLAKLLWFNGTDITIGLDKLWRPMKFSKYFEIFRPAHSNEVT